MTPMALQGSDTYNYSKTMWDFKARHRLAWDFMALVKSLCDWTWILQKTRELR